ncbi:MAG: type VI secretion system ATPase TssH, partial [Chloroflexi bacterium]
VIMTSNLGSAVLQDPRISEAERGRLVMEAVRAHFRPEFLNRVDEIIIFKPLTQEQITTIVDIQLEQLRKRLAQRKITLTLTPAAKQLLASEGYDPTYGARPLKRVIQRRLQDPLALALLEGKFHDGDHIEVNVDRGQLVMKKAERVAAGVAGA